MQSLVRELRFPRSQQPKEKKETERQERNELWLRRQETFSENVASHLTPELLLLLLSRFSRVRLCGGEGNILIAVDSRWRGGAKTGSQRHTGLETALSCTEPTWAPGLPPVAGSVLAACSQQSHSGVTLSPNKATSRGPSRVRSRVSADW